MIKTNIKMRVTPEQSRKVQEICFSKNKCWNSNGHNYSHCKKPYLFIDKNIRFGLSEETFCNSCYEEVSYDLFIKTNGTCEEKYKTEYFAKYVNHTNKDIMPKDYDDALKKISNLRIALNKKVEKNKNQALEITKLLEQKKDLANNYKMVECERNHFMLKSSEHELKINELENLLKEKDIIISYLRSELK